MALGELLGEISPAAFLDEYYFKVPLALPGRCTPYVELGDWAALGRIVAQAEADVIVASERGRSGGPPPTTLEECEKLLGEGYTIGIRHAHERDAGLAQLAASFHQDFLAPVDIHLYCTPANSPGFGWHYDAEDVFILQTVGQKEWSLRKNTVNPWPLLETLPNDMRYGSEIMPLVRTTLHAGDWLYIPSGYWHRTEARDVSISLSVGIKSPTGIDVLDHLRSRLLDSLRWRQRLPVHGHAAPQTEVELLALYQTHLAELGADLAKLLSEERLAREFLASLGRQLAPPVRSPRLG